MDSEAYGTRIGSFAVFRGELSGRGDVRIDGLLEGSVALEGARITVGPEATVRATLSAQEIIVEGRVEGELRTTGRVSLRSTATVIGNIYAARIFVEDDATVRAHVDTLKVPSDKREDGGKDAFELETGSQVPASDPAAWAQDDLQPALLTEVKSS